MQAHHRLKTCRCATLSVAIAALLCGSAVAEDEPNSRGEQAAADNAYIPRQGMSVEDLQAYIERMQEAPASIRMRPGFAEGMKVAAERILDSEPKGGVRRLALITLLDSLHQQADLEENADADKRLAELAAKHSTDEDKSVAKAAALYALEQRVLKADDLSQADLTKLLDDAKAALDGKDLDAKHLRIASATVHAINRLENDEAATKQLGEFGKIFSASDEPLLARYGAKLINTAGEKEEQNKWLGKPMELAGATADGAKFDIAQYKGKVVLVDFWATWCGPCVASLPDLKDTYKQYHKQGFEVVGISLDRDLTDLAAFLEEQKLPWVNLVGEQDGDEIKHPLAEKYGINAIPTTFLVDRDGKIAGFDLHGEELQKRIEKLLSNQKNSNAKAEK